MLLPTAWLPRWKRDRFPTTFVDALFHRREAVFLCNGCQGKMPRQWERTYEYLPLDRYHGQGCCDYCQQDNLIGSLFLPEEGGYAQEQKRFETLFPYG